MYPVSRRAAVTSCNCKAMLEPLSQPCMRQCLLLFILTYCCVTPRQCHACSTVKKLSTYKEKCHITRRLRRKILALYLLENWWICAVHKIEKLNSACEILSVDNLSRCTWPGETDSIVYKHMNRCTWNNRQSFKSFSACSPWLYF